MSCLITDMKKSFRILNVCGEIGDRIIKSDNKIVLEETVVHGSN